MTTIFEIIKSKGTGIWAIKPDATVYDAIQLMADKHVGSLVVKKGPKLVGILTERDYTRKVILKGHSSKNMQVGEIMTTDVFYARPEQTIEECMALMTAKRVRHMPVTDTKKLLGIISMGDLVKATIADQQFMIERLEHYAKVSGTVHKWVARMADKSLSQ